MSDSLDGVDIFNRFQDLMGWRLTLLTLDDDTLEFIVPNWRQFCVQADCDTSELIVMEVSNGIPRESSASRWMGELLAGYARTAGGNMVPRNRVKEFEAAGK